MQRLRHSQVFPPYHDAKRLGDLAEAAHLVSEGQVGEDGKVLGPLDGHEEQPRRRLVHVLRAGRVQSHVVLRGRPLRLVAGHVNVLVDWRTKEELALQRRGGGRG